MKRFIAVIVLALGFAFSSNAQEVKTVTLQQTKGEFVQKGLTLSEGTYMFEIDNNNVGTDVGFVLAPQGKLTPEHHIKSAYVTAPVKNNPVKNNTKGNSKKVTLKKGVYTYFCPLNKTPQYTLTVE